MHVPLRRAQLLMAGQFLNGAHRRSPHRQVRTERMTEYVYGDVPQIRTSRRAPDQALNGARRQRASVSSAEDARPS
jgi:hypothetical protein